MTWTPQWVDAELADRRAAGLLRCPPVARSLPGGRVEVDGRTLLDFAGNDYLGLSHHPEVVAAARSAESVGSGASALVRRSDAQDELERTLAEFEAAEAALVFPTGYAANAGTVAALVGEGDAVFCDRENHSCIVDGCRLSRARFRVYRRADLDRLARDLSDHADAPRRLIATDGVFSMDGTAAPLADLHDLCRRFDATLLVDEAHATGVLGRTGRGSCEAAGLPEDRVVRTGTLSKAVGCQGGFATGSAALIEYLRNAARTQMFSTALATPVASAAAAAVRLIASGAVRWDEGLVEPLREAAARHNRGRWPDSRGPIVPIRGGKSLGVFTVLKWSRELREAGFLVPAIRYPTVPRGTPRLRVSVSAAHSEADVELLAEAVRALK